MTDDIVDYLRLSRTRFNRHAEAADEIDDLRAELAEYQRQYKQLQNDIRHWTRIARMAFTHNDGCLPGCRGASMCTCGYEHYIAQLAQEKRRV